MILLKHLNLQPACPFIEPHRKKNSFDKSKTRLSSDIVKSKTSVNQKNDCHDFNKRRKKNVFFSA